MCFDSQPTAPQGGARRSREAVWGFKTWSLFLFSCVVFTLSEYRDRECFQGSSNALWAESR